MYFCLKNVKKVMPKNSTLLGDRMKMKFKSGIFVATMILAVIVGYVSCKKHRGKDEPLHIVNQDIA